MDSLFLLLAPPLTNWVHMGRLLAHSQSRFLSFEMKQTQMTLFYDVRVDAAASIPLEGTHHDGHHRRAAQNLEKVSGG